MSSRNILFGLGNPGDLYRFTRHNMGFLFLDLFAEIHGFQWKSECREYVLSQKNLLERELVLLKAKTYVNLSGDAISRLKDSIRFEPHELLVICDDFNIPLGSMRLRRGGGDGGHKGLSSIIDSLGTREFPRLRIGIGPLPPDIEASEFVLEQFSKEEEPVVGSVLQEAVRCVEVLLKDGIDSAMGKFNTRTKKLG